VGTDRTLFFLNAMFRDPEPLDGQIDHLASLWQCCGLVAQILLAVLTAFNRMNEHLVGCLYWLQIVSAMAFLATGLLAALFAQALGCTDKTI
jgi:hypothetical protein